MFFSQFAKINSDYIRVFSVFFYLELVVIQKQKQNH